MRGLARLSRHRYAPRLRENNQAETEQITSAPVELSLTSMAVVTTKISSLHELGTSLLNAKRVVLHR